MSEDTLKQFFLDEITADTLAADVNGSVIELDQIASAVSVKEMSGQFVLHRSHLIKLCDAALTQKICPESLSAIAFALIASDNFEWEDDVISEVVADWSAPEINYPITEQTLTMHRNWLEGLTAPPERARLDIANTTQAASFRCG